MLYNPQLETFLCVAESGSFSKAAEKLFITAPAVIKQINSLEGSLNLQLFDRTHRGLIMTEAGKSIYKDAKYIIQYSRESLLRAEQAMRVDKEVIRVGISPMTPPQIFVGLFPKIQELYPEIKFQLIPFENTPENAREILGNLGQNIDVVAGIFDDTLLNLRKCKGIEVCREAFCCAVSIHHRFAKKEQLEIQDLYGENLMMIHRGWSGCIDRLRDDLQEHHRNIQIVDFDFYNMEIFNRCENSNDVLLAVKSWESIHPLMKIIPVNWNYGIPCGLLYSTEPSKRVKKVLDAIKRTRD